MNLKSNKIFESFSKPRFEFIDAILRNINIFGSLARESHAQTAIKPNGDVGNIINCLLARKTPLNQDLWNHHQCLSEYSKWRTL